MSKPPSISQVWHILLDDFFNCNNEGRVFKRKFKDESKEYNKDDFMERKLFKNVRKIYFWSKNIRLTQVFIHVYSNPVLNRCVPVEGEGPAGLVYNLYGYLNSLDILEQVLADLYASWHLVLIFIFITLGKCSIYISSNLCYCDLYYVYTFLDLIQFLTKDSWFFMIKDNWY